jgi:hypothetical protein
MRYVSARQLNRIKYAVRRLLYENISLTNAEIADELIKSVAKGYGYSDKGRRALKALIGKERKSAAHIIPIYLKQSLWQKFLRIFR